ncbi:IclR family transcriptional regulator [Acetomicrobium sp.]|uniref:IclR family transcriptional regulator n=1 Tax=Acetomicrobium sp. TaxID=1872099 RepID=UPI001BD13D58|nr:IclR family transcriptional regulator [Acetomicrobium sp.]
MPEQGKDSKSLQRALKLLSCFSFEKQEWGVTELAITLQEHKSVVHRILITLLKNGYLEQDPLTKKYRLGMRFFELGMIVAENMQLRKIAYPFMVDLHEQTGETVMLLIKEGTECLCIEKVQGHEGIQCTSRVGKRTPLYAGFSKILLAYQPQSTINDIISSCLRMFTSHTITDPEILSEQLKDIRSKGYVVTCGEVDEGSMGIGVPIRDYSTSVVGALSVVGPEFRMKPIISKILRLCLETGKAISRSMGFNDNGSNHVE